MRKGMNSLCGVVQNQMGYDVRMGDCFIFINRTRTTMKILHAEDGGLVLYMKRLVPTGRCWKDFLLLK
jgi:hypothetical protein